MRVLITGGCGFIGYHLIRRMLRKDYNLIILDNLTRGVCNVKDISSEIVFIKDDIRNTEIMEKLIKRSDIVVHLAAFSKVFPSIMNPETCFKINVEGTERIARYCAKYTKKLIFTSSREVYGNALYLPVDEGHPLNPINPYGASKVSAEKIIEAYSKCYGLDYVILRLSNVYGPLDFDRVIPIFIKRAIENKDLIIYGRHKLLDFIYVDDVINAILMAMELDENSVLNIGSNKGISLISITKLIKKLVNSTSNIIIKNKRKGEVEKFIADINKAKKVLKWKPRISLEEGLKKTIKAIKSEKEA